MKNAQLCGMVALLFLACGGKDKASIEVDVADIVASAEVVDGKSEVCSPACEGKTCGPDGCEGNCGLCDFQIETCSDEGLCEPTGCQSTKDCPGDLLCAKDLAQCVVCIGDEDCPEEKTCGADHECHEQYVCESDLDCKLYGLICDKVAAVCVECLSKVDCPDNQFCFETYCLEDFCTDGEDKCDGNQVLTCPDGGGWTVKQICGESQYCEEASCQDGCESGAIWCDGDVYKVCAADGKSVQYEEDCAAQDQHCFGGSCIDTICAAESTFCVDGDTAAACANDGMSFNEADCPAEHFCEEGSCKAWVCEPDVAQCEGSVATMCNGLGSGYSAEVNCEANEMACVDGVCSACAQDCAGKDCGDDGCGGSCGNCSEYEGCEAGHCVPNCGNGTCAEEEGEGCETCPDDCGPCPGLCNPACIPGREECTQVTSGEWVCAVMRVTIPAGNFWMGCNNCAGSEVNDSKCQEHEHPYHEVYLEKYVVDQTEVTVDQYTSCVAEGGCSTPGDFDLCTYGVAGKGGHPVNCVEWTQALQYCLWVGKDLCTEAQWEKAARGGCDKNGGDGSCKAQSRMYPWGNEDPTSDLVAGNAMTAGPQAVCSKSPGGDSPYGLCDMAGNVWERVLDWYGSNYYCSGQEADVEQPWEQCAQCAPWPGFPEPWGNPLGPESGIMQGTRGSDARVSRRSASGQIGSNQAGGFRCCSLK
jgi:formylglycine-generating enzyme required for sulfatase activity